MKRRNFLRNISLGFAALFTPKIIQELEPTRPIGNVKTLPYCDKGLFGLFEQVKKEYEKQCTIMRPVETGRYWRVSYK